MLIQNDISLKDYNTFQIDAKAKFFVEITNEEDIKNLISHDAWINHPHIILGGGANILFTKDYDGLVVKISLMGRAIIEEDGWIYVKVGAGEDWHETMMRILNQWLVWCENLVYIPWTVWAAPIGNIWAYGKEAKDIIFSVEGIDLTSWEKKQLSNAECNFAYRDSIFKHKLKDRFLVTAVVFQVHKNIPTYETYIAYKDIQEEMLTRGIERVSALELADIIIAIRKRKLPDWHKIWTAGSFFKNPIIEKSAYDNLLQKYPTLISRETHELLKVKISAWQLIELAWLKWYTQWYVWVSPDHALILLQYGKWTGQDVVQLAEYIQKKVLGQFAVMLEPEVLFV